MFRLQEQVGNRAIHKHKTAQQILRDGSWGFKHRSFPISAALSRLIICCPLWEDHSFSVGLRVCPPLAVHPPQPVTRTRQENARKDPEHNQGPWGQTPLSKQIMLGNCVFVCQKGIEGEAILTYLTKVALPKSVSFLTVIFSQRFQLMCQDERQPEEALFFCGWSGPLFQRCREFSSMPSSYWVTKIQQLSVRRSSFLPGDGHLPT